jgi:xanthine dehydrogenase YagT iron-sulfur-binding subunit
MDGTDHSDHPPATGPAGAGNPETGSARSSVSTAIETVSVTLRVNGTMRTLGALDPRTTLLDALRDHLGLTGSKKGCDHGQCGACTVHVNGQRVLACLSLAIVHQHDEITTIEGLGTEDRLHPMQAAFIECDAFQCGYCTPGQIMSAVCLLDEAARGVPSHATPDVAAPPSLDGLSDEEIRERMSGNICRCGAYPNILAAIRQVQRTPTRGATP